MSRLVSLPVDEKCLHISGKVVPRRPKIPQTQLAGVYCGFGRQISKSSFFVYFKASGWYYPR